MEPQTVDQTPEEGERLAVAARAAGLPLLLIGGVAVWQCCPSARREPLARIYGHVDLAGRAADRRAIGEFMASQGYDADRRSNVAHAATRLRYHDPVRDRPVDVRLDRFVMAHELDLRGCLSAGELSVPLADLLLMKLQVVNLERRDLVDILAMLLDHSFAPGEIDMQRILDVTHSDWGFEHTIHRTLATVREHIDEFGLDADSRAAIVNRVDQLEFALGSAGKSITWKLRALVGERRRWHQLPVEPRY